MGKDCTCSSVGREKVSRVCVIYTGGTIGMMRNDKNMLAPMPNVFLQRLRDCRDCNDEEYVRENFSLGSQAPLVLPLVQGVEKRILYDFKEYRPLLDSSNMCIQDWVHIAKDIQKVYEHYDGFVILHGTDTLAYTAAALSFMLENLGKPVILTGAQIPIFETRTDGKVNFFTSILFAGTYSIPEVCLFFGNRLLRGSRASKVSSEAFKAFDSLNVHPLATVGINIDINKQIIMPPSNLGPFGVHTDLEENVTILRLFPNITLATVTAMLEPPVKGVVLQTFGSGNAPSNRQDILDELVAAVVRGVIIVNITQCSNGSVSVIYETGNVLLEIGVLPGFDMTQEAAFTKLCYVLGKTDWDLQTKKQKIQSNLRGELTSTKEGSQTESKLMEAILRLLKTNTPSELEKTAKTIFPALLTAAVVEGDIEKLNSLVSYGADLNDTNFDGRTALHIASYLGKVEIVNMLLQNGCSTLIKDRFNRTALHEAIDTDNYEILQLLKDAGACLKDNPETLADVMCALAQRGAIRRLKSFQMAGADLSLPDRTGRTTLHIAAELGDYELAEFLLEHFRNKHIKDHLGHTPMDYAIASGSMHIVHLLGGRQNF